MRSRLPAALTALAAIACGVVVPVGCRETLDTIEGAERAQQEQQRGGPTKKEEAESLGIEVDEEPEAPSETGARAGLEADSAGARLLERIERRRSCTTDDCRDAALEAIRKDKDTLLPGLKALIALEDRELVVEALRLAGLFRYEPALDAVGAKVNDPAPELAAEAVWAVGAIGSRGGIKFLASRVAAGAPLELRRAICRALERIGDPAGLKIVQRIAEGADRETRIECVIALGALHTDDAIPDLAKAAAEQDDGIARAAIDGLFTIGSDAAKAALHRLSRRGPAARRKAIRVRLRSWPEQRSGDVP